MRRRQWLITVMTSLGMLSAGALVERNLVGTSHAGEFNEVLSIGDAAPDWKDLPGADGKSHSLNDFAGKKAVVLVFTCISCPTARDYEKRINALTSNPDVAVVAICSNTVAEDLLPALKIRAAEQKLNFAYLHDESQKVARAYGAVYTPEFYVLNAERKVVYMGAMDDATDPEKVQKRFVEDAVSAALAGKSPEVKEVIARGCRVRYARERRSKPAQ